MESKEPTVDVHDHPHASAWKDLGMNGSSQLHSFELAAEAGSATPDSYPLFGRSLCRSSEHGMIMYMDGFHWTSGGGAAASELPCLNILHPSFTIHTPTQLYGAMMVVFLFAIFTEGCSKFRQSLLRRFHPQRNVTSHAPSSHVTAVFYGFLHRNRGWVLPVLHGIHAFLGYILMLVIMTYSLELFVSVIAGLMVGYFVFFIVHSPFSRGSGGEERRDDDALDPNETTGMISGTDLQQSPIQQTQYLLEQQWSASASNPCCDFLHGSN
jgi:Ctr copper transporter family